jgi:hypothetical protein
MLQRLVVICLAVICFYYLGISHCKQKELSQKVEVVKYVKNAEIQILAAPNAHKSDLLKLMYDNKL